MGLLQAGGGGVQATSVQALDVGPRMRYEPGHPHADTRGYVAYPAIDQATEMVNMSAALRAYEANVVALNASRTMAARALEIGGQ
jgi:flagellar basal-body rod protein FlgC